jgi:hypothetical protein
VHGLLFAPAAWDELADRLQRLLTDGPLRQKLGSAGRAKIEQEFEISRAVTPLVERFRPDPQQPFDRAARVDFSSGRPQKAQA